MCCKYPFVLPEEREVIVKKTGLLKKRFFKKRDGGYFVINRDPCPFLKKGECSIEKIKPLCCRVFPLVLSIEGDKFEWTVSEDCPLSSQVPESYFRKARGIEKKLLDWHKKQL